MAVCKGDCGSANISQDIGDCLTSGIAWGGWQQPGTTMSWTPAIPSTSTWTTGTLGLVATTAGVPLCTRSLTSPPLLVSPAISLPYLGLFHFQTTEEKRASCCSFYHPKQHRDNSGLLESAMPRNYAHQLKHELGSRGNVDNIIQTVLPPEWVGSAPSIT